MDDRKFRKAVHFIYENIDQPLPLETIANEAHVSVASLKRLFKTTMDLSPGTFIRRLRMELALTTLKSRENSVLEIALASGYENQSAFARAFKKSFGYAPSATRESVNIVKELECINLGEPDIIELKDLNLQGITETGRYFESAPKAWQELTKLLNQAELSDDFSGVFIGVPHDNPHEGIVAENEVRFTACIAYSENLLGAEKLKLTGGSYARFRYTGKSNNLGLAYHYIFGQWEEGAKWQIDNDKPPFNIFESFPDPFQQQNIMIHVPLK